MFIVGGFGKNGFTFDSQEEIDQLVRKVATDTAFTLRQVNPTRVIFAVDSKSWRKGIEIAENEGYKGHRTKSTNLNWTNIYAAMDDFCNVMEEKGLISTKIDRAEADDIMALWRDYLLFNKGEHVILVSGDEDIRQLAARNFDGDADNIKFSTIFNPFTQGKNKKKLFFGAGFRLWLHKDDGIGDIFDRGIDPEKEAFLKLTNEHQVELQEINGDEIALRKVFCGDDGDNVPSIYTWIAKTSTGNDVVKRITKVPFGKILRAIREVNMSGDIVDYLDLYDHAALIHKKLEETVGKPLTIKIKDRLKRQIDLVVLNRNVFPKSIVKEFDKHAPEAFAKPQNQITGWHLQTLLEGTRYIDANYKRNQSEASIFKEIDSISQKLF